MAERPDGKVTVSAVVTKGTKTSIDTIARGLGISTSRLIAALCEERVQAEIAELERRVRMRAERSPGGSGPLPG